MYPLCRLDLSYECHAGSANLRNKWNSAFPEKYPFRYARKLPNDFLTILSLKEFICKTAKPTDVKTQGVLNIQVF